MLYYFHPDCFQHDTGKGHPESPQRLMAIEQALSTAAFANLIRLEQPLANDAQLLLVHSAQHLQQIRAALPASGRQYLDDDTLVSSGSLNAALRAAGAVCDAVDRIMQGEAQRAFCAVRPPGHHAEPDQAMGFCLFNNVAIGAAYARQHYGLERIAIVDFDVHHGNGTQAAFEQEPGVFYASSHEMPHYPGTGYPNEKGVGNIVNVPLHAGESGLELRQKYQHIILPALAQFQPQLIFISAGFDAHRLDPLADINLDEADYIWLTEALLDIATKTAEGRLISVLEGGYHLQALASSVAAHVGSLLRYKNNSSVTSHS